MQKFSTAALLLALTLSLPARAEPRCIFVPDAPDTHLVKPGDTLWDLASLFLQNPWCWPRVWDDNRAQVANPHRIYPGQQIVLDRQAGRLRAVTAGIPTGVPGSPPSTVRLTPSIRTSALNLAEPIPLFAPALLQSSARFRLADPAALAGFARIREFADGRQIASAGDFAFADDAPGAGNEFEIVRMIGPISDPDSGMTLALPLMRIGTATKLPPQEAHRIKLGPTRVEVMAGDLLLPLPPAAAASTAPTGLRPAPACEGKIAALMHEGGRGGAGDVVLLNRGHGAGLEPGHLVAVMKHVRIGADEHRPASPTVAAPIATLLVFDTLEHSALALVVQSRDTVSRGDAISALPVPD